MSRMPGVIRDGKKQYLIDTNLGKENFVEWREWIEAVNDDLPEPESLKDVWNDLPPLSPSLIEGVLRKGHKMMLAGPSKAGKSFALIEMAIAIAEGRKWLNWYCSQGRVLYVNLELDRPSCLHRFKDVYDSLGWPANNIANIDIWELRGKSIPMDKLAPKLIRRASKKNYTAIIIDPIYKIITGDENSADQMAHFCNQFDKVCTELNCAVIYCHHHSKGAQGSKRSMDRASGSGVFARDADALLDMIQLNTSDQVGLPGTAWRIEGTLREFEPFKPLNVWFEYPIHRVDDSGELEKLTPDCDKAPWQKSQDARHKKKEERKQQLENAYNACLINGQVMVSDIADYLDITDKTVRRYINELDDFVIEKGVVTKKIIPDI